MTNPSVPELPFDQPDGEPKLPAHALYGATVPPPQPQYTAAFMEIQPDRPAERKRTGLIVAASVAVLLVLGVGIGVGVAVGRGDAATPPAAARSSLASYASSASDIPSSSDATGVVATPIQAPPPAATLTLGSALSLQSSSATTGSTATADVIVFSIEPHAVSSNQFSIPSGQYVKVDVGTTGTSIASFPYNAFDFVLQDTAGQIYQPTFSAGFDPAYNSGDIAQGQSVRGSVVFDIPDAASVRQVNYQVRSGVLGSWALP